MYFVIDIDEVMNPVDQSQNSKPPISDCDEAVNTDAVIRELLERSFTEDPTTDGHRSANDQPAINVGW